MSFPPPPVGSSPPPPLGGGGATSPWDSGGLGASATPAAVKPGIIGINPMDPVGSAQQAELSMGNQFSGLRDALFGYTSSDPTGHHGGILGDVPLLGAGGRLLTTGVAEVGKAIWSAPGHLADVVGGALERGGGSMLPAEQASVLGAYNAIPDTSPAKIAAEKAIAGDSGGPFSAIWHYRALAISQYEAKEDVSKAASDQWAGLNRAPASAADVITNLWNFISPGAKPLRAVEGAVSGMGIQGDGMNRAQQVLSVSRGETGFSMDGPINTNAAGLSPVEQVAAKWLKSGDWTLQQANDFLTAHDAGVSHSNLTQFLGDIFLDPITWVSLGGSVGARLLKLGGDLGEGVRTAGAALEAANASGDAAALEAAKTAVSDAAGKALGAFRDREAMGAINKQLLGRVSGSEAGTSIMRLLAEPLAGALQDSALGSAAKTVRLILDPFHAISLASDSASLGLDLTSDATNRAVVQGVAGLPAHQAMLEMLHDVPDVGPQLMSEFIDNLAIYSGNLGKKAMGWQYKAQIIAAGLGARLAQVLPDSTPDAIINGLIGKGVPRTMLDAITEQAQKVRIRNWDGPALDNLALRAAKTYPNAGMSAEQWAPIIAKMSANQRSLLHASAFGQAMQKTVNAIDAGMQAGEGGRLADKFHRLYLIATGTLTDEGKDGIVANILKGKTTEDQVKILQEAQAQYAELRAFVFEPKNASSSVQNFVDYVKNVAAPHQLTNDEIALMGGHVQQLKADVDGMYTLGFRPEDEQLWNVARTDRAAGLYSSTGDVWMSYAGKAEMGPGYSGGHYLDLNFRGQPIEGAVGHLARLVVKPIDMIEAMANTIKAKTSSVLINDAAHQKFLALADSRHGIAGDAGEKMWDAIATLTENSSNIANPRGLNPPNMWKAVAGLIPPHLVGDVTQRDVLKMVLDSYNGDIRFIGATQKLTASVKSALSLGGSVNYAGMISEHAWPLLRYSALNPAFQIQHKVEGWIFASMRGAVGAFGTKMSAGDVISNRILANMTGNSLVRMADMDMYEQSRGPLLGAGIEAAANTADSPLGRMVAATRGLTNVKGTTELNFLRTFEKGLGDQLKPIWEEYHPGQWDRMKLGMPGNLTDDQFAVRMMSEHLLANDVIVRRIVRGGGGANWQADFAASIAPGAWIAPAHIGAMQSLDLDTMTMLLHRSTIDGKLIQTQAEMRRAVSDGTLLGGMDGVSDVLLHHGADPDYVARVRSAFDFSMPRLLGQMKSAYNLTEPEVASIGDFFEKTAALRGMTPNDFVSQILAPNVARGGDTVVGEMGKVVELMRGGEMKSLPSLSELHAPVDEMGKAIGTRDDLVGQLSRIFSAHLDPSAKRALLMHFQPELKEMVRSGALDLNAAEVAARWGPDAETDLQKAILGEMAPTSGQIWKANEPHTADELRAITPTQGQDVNIKDTLSGQVVKTVHDTVGPMTNVPEDARNMLIGELGRLTQTLPDLRLAHFDVSSMIAGTPPKVVGETFKTLEKTSAILLNEHYFGADWREMEARSMTGSAAFTSKTHTPNPFDPNLPPVERRSNLGVEGHVDASRAGVVRHEVGHALMNQIETDNSKSGKAFRKVMDVFWDKAEESPANKALSEYSMANRHELQAEATGLALNPDADLAKYDRPIPYQPTPLTAEDMRDMPAHLRPNVTSVAGAPTTVEEMVTELRQLLTDHGILKVAPRASENPDIVRTGAMFGEFTTKVIGQGILKGPDSQYASVLNDIAKISTTGAVPYNQTEALLMRAVNDAMVAKWQDAYRLHYFSQSRTMLERSINHPMFGLYPASYMWGKVLPALVHFIAQEPFGVKTGAMLYAMADVQKSVALQREFDPGFDKVVTDLGNSPALQFLGYLMPSLPWDVNVDAPGWARDLAQQGLDSQNAMQQGGNAKTPDLYRSLMKIPDQMSPFRFEKQVHRGAHELDQLTKPSAVAPLAQPPTTTTGPLHATQLQPLLTDQLAALKNAIGH